MITQILLLNYLFRNVSSIQFQYIFYDSIVCNALQAGCIFALWYPVKYYLNLSSAPLLVLYHFLLLLLSFVIWLGLGFLITNIGLSHYPLYPAFFRMILPVRLLFGVLIYIVFVLVYYLFLTTSEIKTQKEVIAGVEADAALAPVEKLTRISVKKRQEIHVIPVSQILYIEANGDYVLIHTSESKYLKDRTMKYWETHLPDDSFVRIHRSFIINIEYISRIELYEKEIYKVQLKNGSGLKASNAGYKLLKQKMQL
jgi:hypothetical protein